MHTPSAPSVNTPARAVDAKHSEYVKSTALFKGKKTVLIEHQDACYRLQITRLGKLILTKYEAASIGIEATARSVK